MTPLNDLCKVMKKLDPLRAYLFMVSINGNEDVLETTSLIRNITWSKDEIIIDSLISEDLRFYQLLKEASSIKVTFLDRLGDRKITQEFSIKKLKQLHPLKIGHSDIEVLVYRFYFEY